MAETIYFEGDDKVPRTSEECLKWLDEVKPLKGANFLVMLGILHELREIRKSIETNEN